MPTEHQRSSCASARPLTSANSLILVQMVSIVPTPARRARAMTASRSSAKSAKSRWQWLSTSIIVELQDHRASFETPPAAAPQDEDDWEWHPRLSMASNIYSHPEMPPRDSHHSATSRGKTPTGFGKG